MSSFALKLLAMITMTLDHTGAILFLPMKYFVWWADCHFRFIVFCCPKDLSTPPAENDICFVWDYGALFLNQFLIWLFGETCGCQIIKMSFLPCFWSM